MSSWAVPGAKVVCVDASNDRWGSPVPLQRNKVYVISGKGDTDKWNCATVFIEGVRARFEHDGYGFRLHRFRPLTKSTKTQEEDIAMFWDILAEEGEKV